MNTLPSLVSTNWLASNIDAEDVKLIDASWRMPGAGDEARAAFDERHIPKAQFFDIDANADLTSDLPHMLAPPDMFDEAVGGLGISNQDRVVIYDDAGLFSAPRVWWTFRAMGHQNVAVLDGGLPKWTNEKRPTTEEISAPIPATYQARPDKDMVITALELRQALMNGDTVVLDARPTPRFDGHAAEPRSNLRPGHMPGATNLPAMSVLSSFGTMKSPEALLATFTKVGVGADTPVVTTCGSGVTAAILSLALDQVGHSNQRLYDGSWAEWGDERNPSNEFPVVMEAP